MVVKRLDDLGLAARPIEAARRSRIGATVASATSASIGLHDRARGSGWGCSASSPPLLGKPQLGDPALDVVEVEIGPVNPQDSSHVFELAVGRPQLGPLEAWECFRQVW